MVFLHADTVLPTGWSDAVAAALVQPRLSGGAFAFGFSPAELDAVSPSQREHLEKVGRWARRRARWLGFVYGDQAIFARRTALDAIGGVPQTDLMEDVDLVSRLRSVGDFAQLDLRVETSPRRYLERGIRTTARRHAVAITGWLLGAPRGPLKRWLGR